MKFRPAHHMILVAFLALAGCTSTAPKDIRFSSASPLGLIIFGLAPERPALTMNVRPIDPATCRLRSTGNKKYEVGGLPFKPNQRKFIVDDLEPGLYVITSVYDGAGYIRFNSTQENRAIAFRVEAGRVGYLGDFHLSPSTPEFRGYDDGAARQHLSSFEGVSGDPLRVDLIRTPFAFKSSGDRITGCALRSE